MKEIIYSKYSNERADRFKIRTDIVRDHDGNKFVEKKALTSLSRKHIENLYNWYVLLSEKYQDTDVRMNKCIKIGDGLRFDFLSGITFEEILDKLYEKEDYNGIVDKIKEFVEKIKKHEKLEQFIASDSFEEVFGKVSFRKTQYAGSINNIDLIFTNIIINNGWNIIDYEWTFDFQIPINFIIYRAIHYYIISSKREKLKNIGIYQLLEIDDDDILQFKEMEHRFQLYILNNTVPLANLYPSIAGLKIDLKEVISDVRLKAEKGRMQIYVDYGKGFNEKDSYFIYPKDLTDHKVKINITPDIKAIRIDPSNKKGILIINEIYGISDDVYKIEYQVNGKQIDENVFLFTTDDPFIILGTLESQTRKIVADIIYQELDDDVLYKLLNSCSEIAKELNYKNKIIEQEDKSIEELYKIIRQKDELIAEKESDLLNKSESNQRFDVLMEHYNAAINDREILNQEVADLNNRLYLALQDYTNVVYSMSWKITKPIRVMLDFIKKPIRSSEALSDTIWIIKNVLKRGRKVTFEEYEIEKSRRKKSHILHMIEAFNEEELEKERIYSFNKKIKFSILVPLYNTPEQYLREMIESVLFQTYESFELCLADGSDKEHKDVRKICKSYCRLDKRIKYKKLRKNGGISYNTNKCINMATGDYIALFDHDDYLHPSALYENMKVIIEENADFIYSDENTFHKEISDAFNPHYKPDFSIDTLRGNNYICHFSVFSRELLEKVGKFRSEFDGSQDYDMILRLTEKANHVAHIPKVIYYWRAHEQSVASDISAKMYTIDAAKRAIKEHLDRSGLKGEVENTKILSWYKINYEIEGNPLISILIPNKDHISDLSKCINSILHKSTYSNYEIIIIENNSEEKETFEYYKKLKRNAKIRVVNWENSFNFSAINNYGFQHSKGEYILLLNNDVEVITPDWLQEMLMFAQRKDVGAVGTMLYYPDDTIQHAGVILGIGGVAGHSHKYFKRGEYGYAGRLCVAQNLSCVTAACLMTKREIYEEIEGFDEDFAVAFNDIDFCMKIREKGYLVVFTPFAELYHYESKSRGLEDSHEKVRRFNGETYKFQEKWKKELLEGDPYYNPNLTLVREDFTQKAKDEKEIGFITMDQI